MKLFYKSYGTLLVWILLLFQDGVICAVTNSANISVTTETSTQRSNFTIASNTTTVPSNNTTTVPSNNTTTVPSNNTTTVPSNNTTAVPSTNTTSTTLTKVSGIITTTGKLTNATNTSSIPESSTSSSMSSVVTSSIEYSSTKQASTIHAAHINVETSSPYSGIEVVAGICIILASFLIIFIVAFLARFERHNEKIKKPNYKEIADLYDEVKQTPGPSVTYKRESSLQEYVNIHYNRGLSNSGTHM